MTESEALTQPCQIPLNETQVSNGGGVSNVMSSAIFTWLGFYLPVDLGAVAWEKKSWKLFGINTSYHLLILVVAAVILTHM